MMRTPNFWHTLNATSAALLPLGLIYSAAAWLDRTFTTPKHAPVPVISLGNITAGGAGKTPATIAVAQLLAEIGLQPHILSRGYGGHTRHTHCVMPGDDWKTVGDEALLLARGAPCWVGRNRHASALAAVRDGATILLMDDGLQHHTLHKDISLLVIDGAYGLGNHLPLPAGPLRESLRSALLRCHAVIMIGEDRQHLTPLIPLPIFQANITVQGDTTWLRDTPWLAFAGIARPQKFFDTLTAHGATLVETLSFADHHPYRAEEIAGLQERARSHGARLITTEKDAVKLPPALREAVTVLPVSIRFAEPDILRDWLKPRLILGV